MLSRFKKIIMAVTVVGALGLPAIVPVASVGAADSAQEELCKGAGGDWRGGKCTNEDNGTSLSEFLRNIVNILTFLVGAIAVIMIVVGGVRYATSNGDEKSVAGAKNTILYAIVGIIVTVMAYAIVNFIISSIK